MQFLFVSVQQQNGARAKFSARFEFDSCN